MILVRQNLVLIFLEYAALFLANHKKFKPNEPTRINIFPSQRKLVYFLVLNLIIYLLVS